MIDVESIESQLARILNDYTEEVQEATEKLAEEVGQEGVKKLRATSPRKRGRYRRNWRLKRETTGKGSAFIMHNTGKTASLTHLLEKGHALKQGGRAKAIPHIGPVEEWAIREYENGLTRRLSE